MAQRAVVAQRTAQLAVARPGGDPGALTHGGGGAPLRLPTADRLRVHLAGDVVPLPVCGGWGDNVLQLYYLNRLCWYRGVTVPMRWLGYLEVNLICPCKSPHRAVDQCPHHKVRI